MKTIEKKILPQYFNDVISGRKTFELRKDEDDIQVGDILILKEWNGEKYTGVSLNTEVTYVLRDVPQYGLAEGYCIIGLLSNMKYVYNNAIDEMSKRLLNNKVIDKSVVRRIAEQLKGDQDESKRISASD